MIEQRGTCPTPDGPMGFFAAWPDPAPTGAKVPALVVIQEAFGVNDHVRDVCRRLAATGYGALAPELFHRAGPGIEVPYTGGPRAMELLGTMTNEGIAGDLAAAFAAVRTGGRADPSRVGVIGFCVGGFAAFLAACRLDPKVTVAFYAGGLVRERPNALLRPLLGEAERIQGPILCLFGGDDAGIPPADVEAVKARLDAGKARHEVVVYPGAKHAFFNDLRPAFHPAAAREAWDKTKDWLVRYL